MPSLLTNLSAVHSGSKGACKKITTKVTCTRRRRKRRRRRRRRKRRRIKKKVKSAEHLRVTRSCVCEVAHKVIEEVGLTKLALQ